MVASQKERERNLHSSFSFARHTFCTVVGSKVGANINYISFRGVPVVTDIYSIVSIFMPSCLDVVNAKTLILEKLRLRARVHCSASRCSAFRGKINTLLSLFFSLCMCGVDITCCFFARRFCGRV